MPESLVQKFTLPYYGDVYIISSEASFASILQLQPALQKLYEYEQAELKNTPKKEELIESWSEGYTTQDVMQKKTLGEAIKVVRRKRRLTQKELGLAVGFPEGSADVRIAQYESNVREPKQEVIKKIESALCCRFNKIHYVECIIEE